MNRVPLLVTVLLALSLAFASAARAGEEDEPDILTGKISVGEKYDSNVDLITEDYPEHLEEAEKVDDAWITEVAATLDLASHWASPWQVEVEAFGLANLFHQSMGDSWGIVRGNLVVSYSKGPDTFSVLDEARYFSEPDDRDFDHFRNSASLVYKRELSSLWQLRVAYENIVHAYPESDYFDYLVNGGFVEVRNTWLFSFSTYYGYGFQYYDGYGAETADDVFGTPAYGYRHTAKLGFEWFFARANTLVGSYTFQRDDSPTNDVRQIGEIRGEEDNLEMDAEFNFSRHTGTLLYSHRFNDRFSLSLYGELIHKHFPESGSRAGDGVIQRSDWLMLGSAWLSARIYDGLYAKARYVYRTSQSTDPLEDFYDHIGYLGIEYRF